MVNVAVNGTVIPSDGPDGGRFTGKLSRFPALPRRVRGNRLAPRRISKGCPTVR